MLTRQEFQRRRTAAAADAKRDGYVLAAFSVGLGLAQMAFLRWADVHMARGPKLAIAGTAFLAYLAGVVALLWRLTRRQRGYLTACPQCGAPLSGMSERIAAATGRCDACGGQVLDDPPGPAAPRP